MREENARSAAQLQTEIEQLRQQVASLEGRLLPGALEVEEQLRYQATLLMNVTDALISTDLDKNIITWNRGAELMFGWTAEEALGKQADRLINIIYLDTSYIEVGLIFTKNGRWAGRTRMSRKDGTYLYVHTSVSEIVDPAGHVTGALIASRDISELVVAERALARSEQRFRMLFERNRAVMIVVDPVTGDMLDGNQAALDFYGYTLEELRKLKVTDLNMLPPEDVHLRLSQAVSGEIGAFIFPHRLASGEIRTVETHPTPIEQDGRTVLYSIIHDITARIQAEEALRESESILRAVFDSSTDIIVLKDASLVYRYANPAAFAMLGKKEAVIGKTYFDFLPEPLAAALQALDKRVIETRQADSGDFAVQGPDVRRWLNVVSTPMVNDRGECTGVVSVIRDITDRKYMETALAESERRYREIIEQQGEGVFITDADGFITYANPMAETLTGVRAGDLVGHNVSQILPAEMLPNYQKHVDMLSQGVQASMEVIIARLDGKARDLFITSTPRFNEQNEFLGAINITRDITLYKQSEKKLRYDATHDALTGVLNRTFYEEILPILDHNGQYPISVIMVDVDGLKGVNDRLGHSAGDLLLQRAAALIGRSTRSVDLVMRTGGDEFVVFLPETTGAQVQLVRERIEQAIAAENVSQANPFTISLSIGCHTSLRPGALKETIALADMEMYHAKRQKKRA